MSVWKQLIFVVVILAAAAFAWARFFPGAPEIMARWGLDWAQAAAPADGQAGDADRQGGTRRGGIQVSVVTRPVEAATINDKLQAIGTGRARASVTVSPYDSGRLVEVTIRSGARVAKGDVLARLDSEAEEIAVDRARITRDDAQARLDRINALRASNTATTVQVSEAELALRNADLAVRDAGLALERRAVLAPIDGIVGIMPVEAGNYVTSQTSLATIDDRSSILVDFWVPERYAGAVAVGAPLEAVAVARPGAALKGTISAVDNRLDEQSRTLRVQAEIANPDDTLRAGMSFQVTMRFPGDTYPSVDPLAIQWGTDGAFVWLLQDGRARRTPVRIIQRNTESVLIEAPLKAGDQVVTEGIHTVREGAELLVAGAEAGNRGGS